MPTPTSATDLTVAPPGAVGVPVRSRVAKGYPVEVVHYLKETPYAAFPTPEIALVVMGALAESWGGGLGGFSIWVHGARFRGAMDGLNLALARPDAFFAFAATQAAKS